MAAPLRITHVHTHTHTYNARSAEARMLNINVGLLGHVDSGKTALAKALSHTASTAAFDKSPQSQSRGITLDLGFSACELSPDSPGCRDVLTSAGVEEVMCTLVDCPGHASLIRTIVGGAQIIDVMILLIDATKGFQFQTAECLVLGEVLARPLVVVVNKVDAVQGATPEEKRQSLAKLRKRLEATFAKTRWPKVPIVEVSAAPRGPTGEIMAAQHTESVLPAALSLVDLAAMKDMRVEAAMSSGNRFRMLVDHCFAVRGQGTVFTGTVLDGSIRVGESVLIPDQHVVKKVKGLQVFRKPVDEARRGDRVGLCVAQYDPKNMERGVLCHASGEADDGTRTAGSDPLSQQSTDVLIAEVHRVRFHTLPCDGHTKYHITIGHTTVMASMRFFSRPARAEGSASVEEQAVPSTNDAAALVNVRPALDLRVESEYVDELNEDSFTVYARDTPTPAGMPLPLASGSPEGRLYFAVLLLDQPVFVSVGDMFIAMRLDLEKENMCRIAMAGHIRALLRSSTSSAETAPSWRALPVVRIKSKPLTVDRVVDAKTCIATGVVSLDQEVGAAKGKEHERTKAVLHGEVQKFVGLHVRFTAASAQEDPKQTDSTVITGVVDSTFGKTGKVKLVFQSPLFNVTSAKEKGTKAEDVFLTPGVITLQLKKYPFAHFSSIQQ